MLQRGIVAHLHEELSSSTERLQAELAEWQGRCEVLEGQVQAQQAHTSELEQDLRARPSAQQVSWTDHMSCLDHIPLIFHSSINHLVIIRLSSIIIHLVWMTSAQAVCWYAGCKNRTSDRE